MGGSNSKHFPNYDWQFVSKPTRYDIERDRRTGISAEKHIIPNNPRISEKDQMQVYHYRNLTNKPIVKVYDAEYVKGKQGACGSAKDIAVHSEYIPYRLSDTRNLNHGQALYILSQALAGFQELHHRFGPFQISDDHIGFNQIGQAKVWHSPNFATNHRDRESIILMSTKNPKNFDERMERSQEQQMVEQVWMAVDAHANISPQFHQQANNFRGIGFLDARKIVANQIARGTAYVPDYLNFRNSQQSGVNPQTGPGPYWSGMPGNQSQYMSGIPQNQSGYQSNVYPYQNNPTGPYKSSIPPNSYNQSQTYYNNSNQPYYNNSNQPYYNNSNQPYYNNSNQSSIGQYQPYPNQGGYNSTNWAGRPGEVVSYGRKDDSY